MQGVYLRLELVHVAITVCVVHGIDNPLFFFFFCNIDGF